VWSIEDGRRFWKEALGKTGFLDFDFPVLDLSCEIPSVLLVFYAEVVGGC